MAWGQCLSVRVERAPQGPARASSAAAAGDPGLGAPRRWRAHLVGSPGFQCGFSQHQSPMLLAPRMGELEAASTGTTAGGSTSAWPGACRLGSYEPKTVAVVKAKPAGSGVWVPSMAVSGYLMWRSGANEPAQSLCLGRGSLRLRPPCLFGTATTCIFLRAPVCRCTMPDGLTVQTDTTVPRREYASDALLRATEQVCCSPANVCGCVRLCYPRLTGAPSLSLHPSPSPASLLHVMEPTRVFLNHIC